MEEEKKVEEVKEEKATLEESETEKETKSKKKEKKERSTFSKILNVTLWVIVLAWMAISLTDFIRTYLDKDPIFCLKEETHKYDDGEVYICTEIGFKFFRYDRASYTARQFGGFWTKEHDPSEKK